MLSSITPLGERSRGFSWALTASAFAVGAAGAGALAGAAGGAVGSLLPSGAWRSAAALIVLTGAVCFDATPLHRRLPSTRRQVNEDWMARYRGWVYGVGFGVQLGTGLTTVVTSAAIYATALGTVLCGTVASGLAVGAALGVTRALMLLPAHGVRDTPGLVRLHSRLAARESTARWLVVAAEAAAIGLVIGGLA
jgi:hypothetical protein